MKTLIILLGLACCSFSQNFQSDIIKTSSGDLELTFIGHGTLLFKFNNKIIHIDPVSREADYAKLPTADLILITHEHGDHLDKKAIDLIKKKSPHQFFLPKFAKKSLGKEK